MSENVKICSKCGIEKPITDFGKDIWHKGGSAQWCKKCTIESSKRYRAANLEKARKSVREWQRKNPEKHRAAYVASASRYRVKRNEEAKQAMRKKIATLQGGLENRISSAIKNALRANKAGRTWESIVGYSVWNLQTHLESKFTIGMTWEKFLKGEIHIDHIIPKARFHYETPDDPEFKVCWGLNNLQPLWAFDNFSKGNQTPEEWKSRKAV